MQNTDVEQLSYGPPKCMRVSVCIYIYIYDRRLTYNIHIIMIILIIKLRYWLNFGVDEIWTTNLSFNDNKLYQLS